MNHLIDTLVNQDIAVNHPTEFLKLFDLPGLPPHIVKLKVGATISLLNKIHLPKLGARLIMKKLIDNTIEDEVLSRISILPTEELVGKTLSKAKQRSNRSSYFNLIFVNSDYVLLL